MIKALPVTEVSTEVPLPNDEKTLIGEIPMLHPRAPDLRALPTTKRRRTTAPPPKTSPDRWLLLTLVVATLAYTMRNALPTPERATSKATALSVGSTSNEAAASPRRFRVRDAIAPAGIRPSPPALSPLVPSPLDGAALETQAAQAWLAGHTDQATHLYQQLTALSPGAPPFAAAATILRAQLAHSAAEPTR